MSDKASCDPSKPLQRHVGQLAGLEGDAHSHRHVAKVSRHSAPPGSSGENDELGPDPYSARFRAFRCNQFGYGAHCSGKRKGPRSPDLVGSTRTWDIDKLPRIPKFEA